MMNYTNYGFPQYQPQQRMNTIQPPSSRMFFVSNILEANAMPVNDLEPVFFYNRAENVIYKKQIDSTGAAPVQIFKLEPAQTQISGDKKENNINPYESNFKAISDELGSLSSKIDKLLQTPEPTVEVDEKNKRR